MQEIQALSESYPVWKALTWCFYPVIALIAIDLLIGGIDDDDDQGGGTGSPVYNPNFAESVA